jgi:hypothetical protein
LGIVHAIDPAVRADQQVRGVAGISVNECGVIIIVGTGGKPEGQVCPGTAAV